MSASPSFIKLWSSKLSDSINCLAVGKPFLEELSEENDILIGTTAGRVMILNQTKPVEGLLETKGGSIQSIQLHDLTGFGALDLAVGDCDGIVTLFSRQQILSKRDLGSAITDITIHHDLTGSCEIIAGDINGSLTSFQQHDALWKINIAEESAKLATLGSVGILTSHAYRCTMLIRYDRKDDNHLLYDIWIGYDLFTCMRRLAIGSFHTKWRENTIFAIAKRYQLSHFISEEGLKRFISNHPNKKIRKDSKKIDLRQVLFAGQDGFVYIMIDFEIFQWFYVGFCLTKIIQFRPSTLKTHESDIVLCTGHSNEVAIYQDGEKISSIKTSDWPHAITLGDVNADGKDELILGSLDQMIEVYEWRQ
ncbi:hypothetical protein A0J61_01029 [Choanephora cucurbitarum]|uniref:Uncharacterized protein n=1 Tax=Choanephora cucurbitarum TaxID=101091 RepID=A0A1C7NPA5_9FUNG|nr:hypothetical protein A0J61_01029 [Choanephora cucurbitarum]